MKTSQQRFTSSASRPGATLFLVMVVMGLMVIVATSAYNVVRSEVQISRQQQMGMSALGHAEAAADYYIKKVGDGLSAGTLTMSSAIEYVSATPPTGINATSLSRIERMPNPQFYMFEVTGTDGDAEVTLEVTFKRRRLVELGMFGDTEARVQPNVYIYSYRSSATSNPTTSTGEASIGSNEDVTLLVGVIVDGEVLLGADTLGTDSSFSFKSTYSYETVGRIDPDPLGAVGGDLATDFLNAASANDNGDIPSSAYKSGGINTRGNVTLDAGTYYLNEVYLGPNSTLNVNTSGGPVKIYLTGEFDTHPRSNVNVNGDPADFRVYSNSTDQIKIYPKNDFKGTVYAPFAPVQIQPNGDYFGFAWGRTLRIQPGGNIWVDVDLLDELLSNDVDIVAWKEVRY